MTADGHGAGAGAGGDLWECPGCHAWQLDISREVMGELSTATLDTDADGMTGLRIDMTPVYEAVDEALEEHLSECSKLADLVSEAAAAADMVAEGGPVTES
jgi:hypothetical protein